MPGSGGFTLGRDPVRKPKLIHQGFGDLPGSMRGTIFHLDLGECCGSEQHTTEECSPEQRRAETRPCKRCGKLLEPPGIHTCSGHSAGSPR